MGEERDSLKGLVDLYYTVKALYIRGEEHDPDLRTNLQPLNEFKAALDHLMRALVSKYPDLQRDYGLRTAPSPSEVEDEYRKARGHIYRAFFDTCDYLGIAYREKILTSLEGFSRETIMAALPTYYSEMRPRIDEIDSSIAAMRERKGQGNSDDLESDVDLYLDQLNELEQYVIKVRAAEGSLVELRRQEREEERKDKANEFKNRWFAPIVVGLVLALVAALLG